MDNEELIAELEVQWTAWKNQVLRLARKGGAQVISETTTDRLGGLTYDEIISAGSDGLAAHLAAENPHGFSLVGLGAMTRETFAEYEKVWYPRTGIPLSRVNKPAFSVSGVLLTLPAMRVIFMGFPVQIAAKTFTITSTTRKYLKLVFTGTPGEWTGVLTLADSVTEDLKNIIVGHATLVNNAVVAVTVPIARIGQATLAQTPRGGAIPATTGTPTTAKSLDAGWFVS